MTICIMCTNNIKQGHLCKKCSKQLDKESKNETKKNS